MCVWKFSQRQKYKDVCAQTWWQPLPPNPSLSLWCQNTFNNWQREKGLRNVCEGHVTRGYDLCVCACMHRCTCDKHMHVCTTVRACSLRTLVCDEAAPKQQIWSLQRLTSVACHFSKIDDSYQNGGVVRRRRRGEGTCRTVGAEEWVGWWSWSDRWFVKDIWGRWLTEIQEITSQGQVVVIMRSVVYGFCFSTVLLSARCDVKPFRSLCFKNECSCQILTSRLPHSHTCWCGRVWLCAAENFSIIFSVGSGPCPRGKGRDRSARSWLKWEKE